MGHKNEFYIFKILVILNFDTLAKSCYLILKQDTMWTTDKKDVIGRNDRNKSTDGPLCPAGFAYSKPCIGRFGVKFFRFIPTAWDKFEPYES